MNQSSKKPVFIDEEETEEEVGDKVLSEGDDAPESAADPLSDDDLIGEHEPREPEQADGSGEIADAARSVDPDFAEDKSAELPAGFLEMGIAPLAGIRVMLHNGSEQIKAFYKRSRRFVDRRWQMTGKWCDAVTGKDIEFEPLAWRSLQPGE